MIVLIAGASHTGKTVLAQKLLETYGYPYLSIDHLKMGLIRSGMTDLTPESDDKDLTAYLWPIVREMIKGIAVDYKTAAICHKFFQRSYPRRGEKFTLQFRFYALHKDRIISRKAVESRRNAVTGGRFKCFRVSQMPPARATRAPAWWPPTPSGCAPATSARAPATSP